MNTPAFGPDTVGQVRKVYNRGWEYKGLMIHVSGTVGMFHWIALHDNTPVFADVRTNHVTPYDARRAAHAVVDQHADTLVKAHVNTVRDWVDTGVVV